MTKVKRPDIQGIRGLAIASVVAFHLKEEQFPAGFVGVDIFFVLSGYLMSSILAREKTIDLQVLSGFYTRRFKRIVPLYAILLLSLFILVPVILLARDVAKFMSDSVWAAAFATNIQSIRQKRDYFAELYDSNVLTHTWSLGVEIQYYLIVPFLISVQRLLGERLRLPYIFALIAASFSFQYFSRDNVSFNALPSRIWQFLGGAIAHELIVRQFGLPSSLKNKAANSTVFSSEAVVLLEENRHQNQDGEMDEPALSKLNRMHDCSIRSVILSVILFIVSLAPVTLLPEQALRATAIALTAALIVLGNSEKRQSMLLSNRPIVYLGDISYVVYLVHWPMVIMWKSYWDLQDLPCKDIMICVAITLLISILIHHTLEQMFIGASTSTSSIVVGVIYLIMLSAVHTQLPLHLSNFLEQQVPMAPMERSALEWNKIQSNFKLLSRQRPFEECVSDPEGIKMRDGYYTQFSDECIWTPNNPTGTVRILVVGNSISYRATKILHKILADNKDLKEMRLFGHSACRPLKNCPAFFEAMMKLVKRMQPDITFLSYDDSDHLRSPIEDIETDQMLAKFANFLEPLSVNSKFLVLDEFYPKAGTYAGIAPSMYKRLLRKRPVNDLKSLYKNFTDHYASYFRRLDQLPAHFPNLIRHNTSGPICSEDPGRCWWYNRKNLHAYYTDHSHFTEDGLELQRESYKKILDELILRVKSTNRTMSNRI